MTPSATNNLTGGMAFGPGMTPGGGQAMTPQQTYMYNAMDPQQQANYQTYLSQQAAQQVPGSPASLWANAAQAAQGAGPGTNLSQMPAMMALMQSLTGPQAAQQVNPASLWQSAASAAQSAGKGMDPYQMQAIMQLMQFLTGR